MVDFIATLVSKAETFLLVSQRGFCLDPYSKVVELRLISETVWSSRIKAASLASALYSCLAWTRSLAFADALSFCWSRRNVSICFRCSASVSSDMLKCV